MVYYIGLEFIGLFLIYLEFFVPGGVMAIGGALFLALSMATFIWLNPSVWAIIPYLVILVFLLVGVCKFAIWQIKRRKKSLYLSEDQSGFVASSFDAALIGKKAKTVTELKPSGHIFVEGNQVQAVSEMSYIPKDVEVIIIGGKGSYYIVKE